MFIAKYFNIDGTLLTELQTGCSYGATDGVLLRSYYCKSSGGALPSVEMMAMKKIRLRRSRPLLKGHYQILINQTIQINIFRHNPPRIYQEFQCIPL